MHSLQLHSFVMLILGTHLPILWETLSDYRECWSTFPQITCYLISFKNSNYTVKNLDGSSNPHQVIKVNMTNNGPLDMFHREECFISVIVLPKIQSNMRNIRQPQRERHFTNDSNNNNNNNKKPSKLVYSFQMARTRKPEEDWAAVPVRRRLNRHPT